MGHNHNLQNDKDATETMIHTLTMAVGEVVEENNKRLIEDLKAINSEK